MSVARAIDDDFLRDVGAAVLGWVKATRVGRWEYPTGALQYVEVQEGTTDALVRDFVDWCSGWPTPERKAAMLALADELIEADRRADRAEAEATR